jgi:outer membrane receptor for ferrienterochelin and colicin
MGIATFWLAGLAAAQQANPPVPVPPRQAPDPFAMDLDSLANTTVSTASKFSEKLSDAPSVITVVSQDELRRFGGITLAEILGRVAGLNVSDAYATDHDVVAVRGDQTRSNSGHVLFLINGRPVRESMEGGVSTDFLESFPVKILDSIEVIKGPGSVLYGSDAYSGVINLITKKADGNGFSFDAGGGGSGLRAASEEIMLRKGDFQLVEAGQYHQDPRWNVDYVPAGAGNLVSQSNATLRNDGTGAYLGVNYRGLSFMSSYTAQEAPSFVRGIIGDVRWKRGFADLGYARKISERWQMTFDFTYTRSVIDAPDYPGIHRDTHEADLEWTNFMNLSDKDRLTFGTVYTYIQGSEYLYGTDPRYYDARGSRSQAAGYAEYSHKLTDDLKLVGGVQVNKIGAIALNAVPRGGVVWNLADHWTVKALYGGAFHAPSIEETSINHPGLIGDPHLVPEKVGTFDLPLSYQTDRFRASIGYFHSRQTDLIVHFGASTPAHYYNLGTPLDFQGFESEAKVYLHANWYVTGSANYQTNNSPPGQLNLSTIPNLGAKAGVSYLSQGGTDVSIFDSYQGHIAGYGSSPTPLPGAAHSISAHVRYDLSKHWLKDNAHGFALFVHADDLLNKAVWLPALGTNEAGTIPVTKGRTILFGIEVWQKKE